MRLILVSVLVAIASASPALLGSNKCTYGPSYWCSHVKHARECGAMKHCMTAVWKFNIVPVKSDAECEVCVFGMTEARKLLKDHATQEEIVDFLEKGCQLVPDAKLKSECENVVKNYLPEILQLLASDVDPKAICAAIGMCTAELSHPEAAVDSVTTAAPPDVCADCKKFLNDLEATLKDNATLGQIEASLDQLLCASLGPLQAECKQLVAQYTPIILDMFSSEFNPGVVCRMLGLCSTSSVKDAIQFRVKLLGLVKQLPMSNNIDGPEECSICKMVMTELQSLDRDAKTQQTVESFLETNFCGLLGEMKAQCQELIKDYAPMIFEYLANELDPEVACKAFHLCTASQQHHNKLTAVSLVNSALSVRTLDLPPVKAQTKTPQPQSQSSVKASGQCILCEFILKEVDSLLAQNASRTEVTQALEAVCAKLPDTIATECKAFVDEYAAAVIEMLVADLDPAQVCTFLGLCSRSVLFAAPKASEGTCDICKLMIQYLDSLLKENATEAEIIALLEKICNFLPDTLKQQCDSIVEQYGPMIAQLLAQLADPLKICQEIGLCANSTIAHHSLKQINSLITQAKEDNTLYYHNKADQGEVRLNCLTGPSVWCKDAATANKCGVHAVNYCQRHVWV